MCFPAWAAVGRAPGGRLDADPETVERFKGGVLDLLTLWFGADVEGPPTRDEISMRYLGKRKGLDPQTFVRLVSVLARVGPHGDSALLLRPQALAQGVPSLDKHERLP